MRQVVSLSRMLDTLGDNARAGLGTASLVLRLPHALLQTDASDAGFRELGFSRQRRLKPQITIGRSPTQRPERPDERTMGGEDAGRARMIQPSDRQAPTPALEPFVRG
jgi:hypothetical protein